MITTNLEFCSNERCGTPRWWEERLFFRYAVPALLTLSLVSLWSALHHYKGLSGDAELYAMQALAKQHSGLAHDVYLKYGSQDRYTIFSTIYSWCIGSLGLHAAALTLTVICTTTFLLSAWILARALTNGVAAFYCVAFLIIVTGAYGGSWVFRYSEDWLTARSMAEALIVMALAFNYTGSPRLGLAIAATAMIVHPIMAFPGILLLTCLRLSFRTVLIGSAAGIGTLLVILLARRSGLPLVGFLQVIDGPWLEVVTERSQFLFLQNWSWGDWDLNLRPLTTLVVCALTFPHGPIRRLCLTAMVIGATGLAVGWLAGAVEPVAVLIQGQAWRWTWVTTFIAVLMLAPAALQLSRNDTCGPLCAILMIAAWTYPAQQCSSLTALALLVWLARGHITSRMACLLRPAALALGLILVMWAAANSWTVLSSPHATFNDDTVFMSHVREIAGLHVPAVLFFGIVMYWIRKQRSVPAVTLLAALLLSFSVVFLRESLADAGTDGTVRAMAEFTDWRARIPEQSTVFVTVGKNAAFAWFTLQRASYLSVDQSAGVVFSRATALEIKRRSEVLQPVMDPDWKLLSANRRPKGPDARSSSKGQTLTAATVAKICLDPELGFVISKGELPGAVDIHSSAGPWKDWSLYECRRVRAPAVEQ